MDSFLYYSFIYVSMDVFGKRIVLSFQKYRSKKLAPLGKWLRKLGISANLMTFFALFSGLLSIYFLFSNNLLFIVFMLLHLLADVFDGVLARLTKSSDLGKFLDHVLSDGLVTVLPLFKIAYLYNFYGYVGAILFSLALIFYALSKFQAPIVYMRLFVVITLLLILLLPALSHILISTLIFSVAIAGIFSLIRQSQWFLGPKKSKSKTF
jgi:phosphatidylglycerophosphate synthase